jgi:histidinol-phosphate aminotransferase
MIEYLSDSVKMNSDGYSQLVKGFEAFKLNYIPSYANFIAVEFDDAMGITIVF